MEEFKNFGPDRIVGVSEDVEDFLKTELYFKVLQEQERREYEREMTFEEWVVIESILNKMPDFLKEYGLDKTRKFFPQQVHFLDKKSPNIESISLEEGLSGSFEVTTGRISIVSEDINEYLSMAHIFVHELMHANSFVSFEVGKDKEGAYIKDRRVGVQIISDQKSLFKFMNEAVTEELTRRFVGRHFRDLPHVSSLYSIYKTEEERQEENKNDYFNLDYAYVNERITLNFLIQEIYERNKEQFVDKEEVFKLFSRAYLTGRILELARILEKSFGKGFFAKIGDITSNPSPDFIKEIINNSQQEKES